MADWSENYRQLWKDVRKAKDVPGLLSLLDEVEMRRSDGRLTAEESSKLTTGILDELREATRSNHETALAIILERLLPICLAEDDASTSMSIRVDRDRCRELVRQWLEQFPESQQGRLRTVVIETLRPYLRTDKAKRACWVLREIGFRDDTIVDDLLALLEPPDETGRAALNAIVSLGVSEKHRSRILNVIGQLVNSMEPQRASFALKGVAGYDTLDLTERLVDLLEKDRSKEIHLHVALSGLASVADRYPDDESLQDRVWERLSRHPDVVRMDSRLAAECNSSGVIPDLLGYVAAQPENGNLSHLLWLVNSKLEACIGPRHLASWSMSKNASVLPVLHRMGCGDSGQRSRWATIEAHAKEDAWRWILSIGAEGLEDWLEEAVAGETSPYVQHSVMEIASCLAFPVLPHSVERLIVDEYHDASGEGIELFPRLAAIRIAQSSATRNAFQALLGFGLTSKGGIFLRSAQAVADVAVWLASRDDTRIMDDLVGVMDSISLPRHREAAARALHDLALARLASDQMISRYIAWIRDKSLPDYSRAELIESLSGFSEDSLLEWLGTITEIASQQPADDVVWQALVCLVRRPTWSQWEQIAWKQLGWDASAGQGIDEHVGVNGWRAWLVGELFIRDQERFAGALAFVLRRCDSESSYQLARCLRRSKHVPAVVVAAIMDRIRDRVLPHSAETHLFGMLAKADPATFLSESVFAQWQHWRADCRVAFLNAHLVMAREDLSTLRRMLAVFGAATSDGTRSVRECAYQGLMEIDSQALLSLCKQWSLSEGAEIRVRAAEAMKWIPATTLAGEKFPELLRNDAVRIVRATAEEALKSSQQRTWIRSYLNYVKGVRTADPETMFRAFPYGEALSRLGDAAVYSELTEHLRTNDLPPNVQNWLDGIRDNIDKNLRKSHTTEGQQAWFGWDPIVEEFQGTIASGSNQLEVTLTMWRRPPEAPGEIGDWNGTATLNKPASAFSVLPLVGEVRVEARGRQSATAFVTSYVANQVFVLSGSGRYPHISGDGTATTV